MSKKKRSARKVNLYAKGIIASAAFSMLGVCGFEAMGGNPSANSSYASNYSSGSDVNPQTGQVPLSIQMLSLPGINSNMSLSLSVILNQDKPAYGISSKKIGFALPYLDLDDNPGRFYSGGGGTFILDGEYKSGFRYINSESFRFEKIDGCFIDSMGTSVGYSYIVRNMSGMRTVFDSVGKLKGYIDKYEKTISYFYEDENCDPFKCRLSTIVDSFGQAIKITSDQVICVERPDGIKASLVVNEMENKAIITDYSGITQTMSFDPGTGHVNEKQLPTGGMISYTYKPVIRYGDGSEEIFYAVTEVEQDPCDGGVPMITRYEYGRDDDNEHNFTGFNQGTVKYDSSSDKLMESNDDTYLYSTYVTSIGDGKTCLDSTAKMTFNRLHLPIFEYSLNHGGNVVSKSETWYSGELSGDNHSFPNYNNLPGSYDFGKRTESSRYSAETPSKKNISETIYDNDGLLQQEMSYNYKYGEYPKVISSSIYSYFGKENYCLPKSSNTTYENGNGIGSRSVVNRLTDNGMEIGASTLSEAGSSLVCTNTIEFDKIGRVVSTEISANNTSQKDRNTISYNKNGDILESISTDAAGLKNISGIDIRNGKMAYIIGSDGSRTDFEDSYNGLMLTIKYQNGRKKTIDFRMLYNGSKNNRYTECTTSDGMKSRSYYDGLGRVIKNSTIYPDGSEVVLSTASYNCKGDVCNLTDIYGRITRLEYLDPFGRITKLVDSKGNYTQYAYDDCENSTMLSINGVDINMDYSNSTSLLYSQSHIPVPGMNSFVSSRMEYDGLNRPVIIEKSINSGTKSQKKMEYRKYDTAGNIVKSSIMSTFDGFNATSNVQHEIHGMQVSLETDILQPAKNCDMPSETFKSNIKTYDNRGILQQISDKFGNKLNFYRDNAGQLRSIVENDGASRIEYTYDENGSLKTVTVPNSRITYDYYDGTENQLFSGLPKSIRSEEFNGNASSVMFRYDEKARLNEFEDEASQSKMNMSYDKYNRISSLVDCKGISTMFQYHGYEGEKQSIDFNALKSVQNQYGSVEFGYYNRFDSPLLGDKNLIKQGTYRDGNGNPVMTVNYKYYGSERKELPRIKEISYMKPDGISVIASISYTYNKEGSVETRTISSSSNPSEQILNNKKQYTYNSLGMIIKEIIYDSKGQLAYDKDYYYYDTGKIKQQTVRNAKGVMVEDLKTYYDVKDRVILNKYLDGSEEKYSYDEKKHIIRKTCKDGHVLSRIFNDKDELIEEQNAGSRKLYTYGACGNVSEITEVSSGKEKSIRYMRDSFGNILNEEDQDGTYSAYLGALNFSGELYSRVTVSADKPVSQEWYLKDNSGIIGTVNNNAVIKRLYEYNAMGVLVNEKDLK